MNRLWQLAEVVETAPGELKLRVDRASACARCAAGKGCGAGVFMQLFGRRILELPMPAGESFAPGDRVRVGVRADGLMRASLVLYGLPVVVFLVGAVVGQQLFAAALASDLAALALGLAAGGGLFAWMSVHPPTARLDPAIERLKCGAGLESGAA